MKNRIFAVLLVVSLVLASTLTVRIDDDCANFSTHAQIVQLMTVSSVALTVHNHAPNNHNLQELALTLEKTHEFANSADYMEGLTASSKRSVYVGDAERRFSVRINI